MPTEKTSPLPSIQRLPSYLRLLDAARKRGESVISCTHIAEELGQLSVQVRKDLAITGVTGRPKVGYRIDELIDAIKACLGWDKQTNAFLVGIGNLGSAILNYQGFVFHGLNIVGAFDASPQLYGKVINGHKVFAFEDMVDFATRQRTLYGIDVTMGIITVPAVAAQEVANSLLQVGVRAIWNYAPVTLELPDDVLCENVKLSESFAILTHRMKSRAENEERLANM